VTSVVGAVRVVLGSDLVTFNKLLRDRDVPNIAAGTP
jgi:hypothetical protein